MAKRKVRYSVLPMLALDWVKVPLGWGVPFYWGPGRPFPFMPGEMKGDGMPVRSTSAQATAKWVANLSAATERMTAGAQAVQTAPGQAAAAAADKWLARVTQAKQKFATNVAAVSLQSWQNSYINIGIPRVAQGAQAKQAKVQSFMDQFLPYLQNGVAQIDKMPSTTLQDGIARATAMITYNSKFKRSTAS